MKNLLSLLVIATLLYSCGNQGYKYMNTPAMAETEVKEYLPDFNTEEYDRIYENDFLSVLKNPQSTFSIDVDAASYSNSRRFLLSGDLPPKDAVRIEEFVNYFDYDYAAPTDGKPFAIHTELSQCPWNSEHQLLHIGLKGEQLQEMETPPSNLVFLLDVSGSMEAQNKLPLLKSSFNLLVNQLDADDKIAIVTYAGDAGVALNPTSCSDKEKILNAINELESGGATAGSKGIKTAYNLAEKSFIKNGNNRIILATDGDFNVGVSSDAELLRLIEEEREKGIFLSVLGFGTGNYKDSKMEKIADHGNGNFYYIDNLLEAKKVLVTEIGGTLHTIAKDVKIQIEFNPTKVQEYRLIGYENRLLNNQDFEDDTKDAGELGAGHTVTALYEIVPASGQSSSTAQYKYQSTAPNTAANSDEVATIKFRYKEPDGDQSKLIVKTVQNDILPLEATSDNYKYAASVAEFALLLRDSKYKGSASYDHVLQTAQKSRGEDVNGYRSEFINLVTLAKNMK